MTNKPNLYVFVVDASGSMSVHESNIENYIYSEIEKIKKNTNTPEQNHFIILAYNDSVKTIKNNNSQLLINYYGNEDFNKLKFYLKHLKKKNSKKFNTTELYLITDLNGSNVVKEGNIYNYFTYVKIFVHQTAIYPEHKVKNSVLNLLRAKFINSLVAKLSIVLVMVFITVTINVKFCDNTTNNINILVEKEKELDRKTQPIINNIVQNTNITIINVFNQFKIDIKPTINFNFNFDTEINNQVNFHINIPYSSIDSSLIFRHKIENYELGKYNIRDSLITILIRRLVENKDINNYYLSSKNTKLKIIGETDSVRITGIIRYKKPESLPYVDIDKIIFVNGKEQNITIRKWQQIKENYELGFLRAYFIGEFVKQKVDLFKSKNPEIEYHSKTNCCIKGGKYRTTEIELIIYDVKIPDM